MFVLSTSLFAQSDITAIAVSNVSATSSTDNVTSPSDAINDVDPSTAYTLNYGSGNDVRVTSYTVGGVSYNNFLSPDTLLLRRISTSRLVNIWYEDNGVTSSVVTIQPTKVAEADAIYLSNALNTGYDNILVNEDDLAGGSIEVETERVDVIWYSGIQTPDPAKAVFPIIERGGNDNIIVAPILSIDANGDPASYGTLVGIGQDSWPGMGQTYTDYIVLRRETVGVDPIPLLDLGTQTVQGVAVSFTDMGVAADETIFGYSIFPADIADEFTTGLVTVPAEQGDILTTGTIGALKTGVVLTDITTFPTNTLSSDSGLDLVAGVAAGVATSDNIIIENKGPGGYKAALSTWLKANEADDITTSTDGSGVLDWQDHWIGNHDATVGAAQPIYRSTSSSINFNPTVDFDGDKSLTIANNTDFNTAASYAKKGINLAFRTNTTNVTDRQVLYEQGGATRGINVYIRSGNLHISSWNRNNDGAGSPWNNGTNVSTVSTAVSANTEYIVTLELSGNAGVSGTLTGYLNGTSFGSVSSVGLLFSDTDGIEFGGTDGTTQYDDGINASAAYFRGEISELIYCNEPTAFSTAQRDRIESYLAIKYGITLDQSTANNYVNSGGTVIFDATNNASLGGFLEYNNDIAGIGRDDNSELDQPKSRSENTDGIVIVDRGATIGTDDAWLIWGNDNGALTETSALTMPDTIDARLNRVWRVAEEKEVQTTSVSFDLAGLGLSSSAASFSLLIAGSSSAANFSSATVVTGGTFNGDVITFTGVNLEDGEYFTLGTDFEICAPGGVETDLALWLRADVGTNTTTNGADVTSWQDQSLSANNASETNGGGTPVEPTYTLVADNFNPAIAFTDQGSQNSTNSWLTTSANPATDDMTLIAVFSTTQTDATGFNQTFDAPAFISNEDGGGGNLYALGHSAGRLHASLLAGTDFGARSTNTYNDGVPHMALSTRVKSAAAGSIQLYLDGASDGSAASDVNSLNKNNGIGIGNHLRDDFDFWDGQFEGTISEVIVFSDDLTSDEKNRVETYLAIKYGITKNAADDGTTGSVDERDYRDSNGTVIWDFTDQSSGYNNDIAGIGRDDAQCFQQKQSASVSADGIITMGLGNIASSNATNANSFAADNSFQVWGSDNDATAQASANTSDLPSIVTERMERIWHVQETGTVGETAVTFDLTGLGYTGTSAADFNLITSSTSTMASGTITPAASFVGNKVTFTGVNFSDGDFFTIGTARSICGPGGVTTNLELWLRADVEVYNTGTTLATDGQTVSGWDDQSLSAANATDGSNLTTFETNTINFNPAIQFSNDATSLEGSFTTATAGITMITAAFVNSASVANDAVFEMRIGATATTGRGFLSSNRYGSVGSFSTNLKEDEWAIWSVDHPSGSTADIYQDGTLINDDHNTDVYDASSGTYNYTLGDDDNGGNDFEGFLGDVIAFQGTITATERQQIETYLAIKYGVTINQTSATNYLWSDGSTVLWNATTNASYNEDIAGIGRDDASCFSQRQSKSGNADAILSIGLGTVATSNADNINTFTDDGDYLIWGNDGGATAEASKNIVDVPNSVSERMTRIWKVDDTGAVGATELQFDLTGTGFSVADATAFTLLVGNTATMADASIISGGTLNGNILSFTGVNLTDGQFFTIGTGITICGPGGVNTNIALWLKANAEVFSDAGTTPAVDGNDVQQWNDQGTANLNASEVDLAGLTPIEPTFQTNELNFNPVIDITFPGSNNASYLRTGAPSAGTVNDDFTLISVFRTGQAAGTADDQVNSPALISTRSGSGLDHAMGMENGTIWVNADSDDAFEAETSGTFNDSSPHIATSTRDQSTGDLAIYLDAASAASATGITTSLTNADGGFGIGNHFSPDQEAHFAGDIAETIVFNQTLTSDERNRIESYLAIKYGITLNGADDGTTGSVDERDYRSGDGGDIWDYSDKTAYSNGIFGIGRDDLSCLNQTQSKSENSDAIVTINNAGGFGVDDSWLVSGNDGAAIEATRNPERPATINSRLNREWQVQETGTVGSVELTFDLSSVTGTESGSNNLTQTRLMVDDDGDFSNGGTTLISPSATNGGSKTVTFNVNFTDGQYYTLGSIESDALPITLISFEANVYKEDQVKLDWVTAAEVNNAFYAIERSSDGVNFETIANLDGAGNSSDLLYYSFVDANPINGTSFYRLKQTDYSGEFDFSEMRSVKVERHFEATFSAYPNPVVQGDKLKISYTVENDQAIRLTILDTRGQVILNENREIRTTQAAFEIATDRMSKGLNLIRILDQNNKAITLKVIVR